MLMEAFAATSMDSIIPFIPFDTMVRKYPMEAVGAWCDDYESQCYIEECHNHLQKLAEDTLRIAIDVWKDFIALR